MKTNKILIGTLLGVTILTTSTYANFGNMRGNKNLTDTEKTAIESMTTEEKQAFMETKRAERQAQMESRELVLDKVLAGENLTAEEKTILEDFKLQRAERKSQREDRKQEKSEIRSIIEKMKSGETLTQEEQEKLDNHGKGNKGACGNIRKFDGNGKNRSETNTKGRGRF